MKVAAVRAISSLAKENVPEEVNWLITEKSDLWTRLHNSKTKRSQTYYKYREVAKAAIKSGVAKEILIGTNTKII